MPDPQQIDRRQFAQQLSVISGSTALLIAGGSSIAAQEKPQSDPGQPPAPPVKPKPPSDEILLLSLLMSRYPSDHYDEAALRGIASDLRGDIARGKILSGFGLKNSDEPSSVFRAYRSAES